MRGSTGGFAVIYLTGAIAVLAVTDGTWGQTCYRVSDLRALQAGGGFVPGDDDRFGINNSGEVVFTAEVTVGEQIELHAFVWLPQPKYNLSKGLHDLGDGAGLTGISKAHDISDSGLVVGQNGPSVQQMSAFVWKLNEHLPGMDIPIIDLSTFITVGVIDEPTDAWAINDAAQPVIVGEGIGDVVGCVAVILGFQTKLDGSNLIETLLPFGSDEVSQARDVNIIERAVGISSVSCALPGPCSEKSDAVWWVDDPDALADLGLQGSEGRGNNDNDQIVGWGFQNRFPPCRSRALFWEDIISGAFDLHALATPPLLAGQESRAEAINNLVDPQVVGRNMTQNVALIWERQPSPPAPADDWVLTNLNDVIAPCANDNFDLLAAHDINDNGWIIAIADRDPDAGNFDPHAILLTPCQGQDCVVVCDPDIDNDGTVFIPDLLILLAAWGPCLDVPACCRADLNCDGAVNVPDLLELLAAWGPCPLSGGSEPLTLEEEIVNAGLYWPHSWDEYMECLDTGTPEEVDNCNCWMHHYLHGDCNGGQGCPHPSCPDDDPFGGPHIGI